jgi:hypothetical protein
VGHQKIIVVVDARERMGHARLLRRPSLSNEYLQMPHVVATKGSLVWVRILDIVVLSTDGVVQERHIAVKVASRDLDPAVPPRPQQRPY